MKKAMLLALLIALLLPACLAEAFSGVTVADGGIAVLSPGGTVEKVHVLPGQLVYEGDTLIDFRAEKIFATQDGTIAQLKAKAGDKVSGEFMKLNPVSPYLLYCSVSSAYSDVDTKTVHIGEELYIKCTKNGTHRAKGIVTSIDGKEYHVVTTAGELYLGETLYLYRDAEFSAKQRVGIATVVGSDAEVYEAEGVIRKLYVEDDDFVERGQLLCEIDKDKASLSSPSAAGIVTAVNVAPGDVTERDQILATVVPVENILVKITATDENIASLRGGHTLTLSYANDPEEREYNGAIERISAISGAEGFEVLIRPAEPVEFIGLSVTVFTDE